MHKQFMGGRLRRLREEARLTQAELARRLGLSASYLNQLENNQRPLTVAVLLKLKAQFGAEVERFGDDEGMHLVAQLREIAHDLPAGGQGGGMPLSQAEIKELVANMPGAARALVTLYQQRRHLTEQLEALTVGTDAQRNGQPAAGMPPSAPYEEVRDFFFARNNHIALLDEAAEAFAQQCDLPQGAAAEAALVAQLRQRHGVQTRMLTGVGEDTPRMLRHYDPQRRVLCVRASISAGQRAFQLATQLALLEAGSHIDLLVQSAGFGSDHARGLARIGLANYYAGALLLPYGAFLQAARDCRYDVEVLSQRFGVGFETICHRLSTLQRPSDRGIPFFFIRVDRAGNISKRQSATHFHFSKIGGTCPLWNVYEAFAQPGRIVVQLARMPDGRTYLWLARTVSGAGTGWGRPRKTFSVALGCDIRHARELVYAQGLDLADPQAAVPIGMGCKVCERQGCTQRAFPPLGRPLQVDENVNQSAPYAALP
ncbi:Cro/Cl family transcriptional regulator [Lampropedia cohaerens]|uniref:Cro/Cl family transcriptional regulator n=1 Tax=Lampropedia cohaerens TaxID=1610491 RepID=A0A0U1PY01_9BURK|nr:short-chain fatty acyl-CoA regulator family protein [Lampropedia cohaerens]KKW67403.1 Cro/Cl family transcriptional regulator [Lampropedia cohaerens]